MDTLNQKTFFKKMKINCFQGGPTDISAKKEALTSVRCQRSFRPRQRDRDWVPTYVMEDVLKTGNKLSLEQSVLPKYRLGHPNFYFYLLSTNIFVGSKYPRIS